VALSFLYLAFLRTVQILCLRRTDNSDLAIEVVMPRHRVAWFMSTSITTSATGPIDHLGNCFPTERRSPGSTQERRSFATPADEPARRVDPWTPPGRVTWMRLSATTGQVAGDGVSEWPLVKLVEHGLEVRPIPILRSHRCV